MEPVKLATCRAPHDRGAAPRAVAGDLDGVPWLRFGDDLVYVGTAQQMPGLAQAAGRAGVALSERPGAIDRKRLHVVIQKGRLFQREHPKVPVLVDKGRYLLVDMAPTLARKLAKRRKPCFTVRTLSKLEAAGAAGKNRTVFEARGIGRAARAADPAVQALVNRITRATYEADLTALVALPTRLSTSTHYQQAADQVKQKLAALGYATKRQSISVNGKKSQNVIASRKGSGPASRGVVVVSAHLDSVNHEGTATSPAPGADDDGSGSAGVIAIARALANHTGFHDLVFVLFGGEEQGLFGSREYVRALTAAQRAKVRAVVNMDMIATLNIPAATVLLEGRALSQSTIDGLATAAATYTGLAVETSLNAANSDHVSFLDKGMPAVLTIEGADSTNEEIHTARDTLDRINFDLALDILRMNTAFVAQALAAH
jgi:Peptidase family M28